MLLPIFCMVFYRGRHSILGIFREMYCIRSIRILKKNCGQGGLLIIVNLYKGNILTMKRCIDDDDIARQKRCIYAQTNVLAIKFHLCSSTIKTTLFNSYYGSMYTSSLWRNF